MKIKVDLVELIRTSGVELDRSGKGFLGRCPFHDDSIASLAVTPGENLWNCFGCEAGGDTVEWIRLKEKLDFPQALERLKQMGPAPAAMPRPDIMATVCEIYHRCLMGSKQPQNCLKGRGLGGEVWQAFRIGYCDGTPPQDTPQGLRDLTLLEFLYGTGLRLQECTQVDLQDLSLEKQTVWVQGKRDRLRLQPLGPRLCEKLGLYLHEIRPALASAPK